MRRTRQRIGWIGLVGALLCLRVAGQGARFEVTDEQLARWAEEALPALREELGVKLEGTRVLVARGTEVRDALEEENAAILGHVLGDESLGALGAKNVAEGLAPGLLAKFAFGSKTMWIQPQVFVRFEKELGIEGLASHETLRAIVLHELVHAADDERFDLMAGFLSCSTQDALLAYNHVIEGHAQLVARRLAPRLGWETGFERYLTVFGATPRAREDEASGGQAHVVRLMTLQLAQLYTEGERFLAALDADGGQEAVDRALREPPTESVLIAHPRWFLHPEERPANLYDLEALLDVVSAELDEDEWSPQRVSVPAATLTATLAPLTPEEVQPFVAEMRQNRILAASSKARPDRQVLVAILEFATPVAAEHYVRAMRTMQDRRDEQWKEGGLRIEKAEYRTSEPPEPPGFSVEKRVIAAGQTMDITALYAFRGSLAMEMVSVAVPDWDEEHLIETASAVLKAARDAVDGSDGEAR